MNCTDSVEIFCDWASGAWNFKAQPKQCLPSQRHLVLPRSLWFPYYCLKDVLSHLTSITVSYLVSISQLDKLLGNQVTRASPPSLSDSSAFTSTFHLLTFSTKKHFAFSLHLIPFYFTHSLYILLTVPLLVTPSSYPFPSPIPSLLGGMGPPLSLPPPCHVHVSERLDIWSPLRPDQAAQLDNSFWDSALWWFIYA